jgi:hypothetical protein
MTPFDIAIYVLLVLSASFEPVRNALWIYGDRVGGVGGVGGLMNLYGNTTGCNPALYEGNYCFYPGLFAGFTPMALVILGVLCLPFLLSALYVTVRSVAVDTPTKQQISMPWFSGFWVSINIVWGLVPMASYLSSPFYQATWYTVVLGVSLVASHPLSWNLMFVAFLSADILPKLSSWHSADLKKMHIFVAYSAAICGAIHGFGQVVYLFATGTFLSSLDLTLSGENILFVHGLALIVLLTLQTTVGLLRKSIRKSISFFRTAHSSIAFVLLIVLTVHWWPFVIFMLPTIAIQSVSMSFRWKRHAIRGKTDDAAILLRLESPSHLSASFGLSLFASICSTALVWHYREIYMMSDTANLYIPFVFPFVAILASTLGAILAAQLYLATVYSQSLTKSDAELEAKYKPLIVDSQSN